MALHHINILFQTLTECEHQLLQIIIPLCTEGISTVTMKDGPVKDVPTKIILMDESAVSIWLNPSKTKNHFGNTPIYGTQHLICVESPNYCK